jgi:drug/metabolite transporter (DMT)-like permease
MALANYLVPVWAVIMGALIFDERLAPRVFVALVIILFGVAVSQRRVARTTMAVAGAADQTKI